MTAWSATRALGVDVLQGYARIVDPWTVEVALNGGGTKRLTTRSIVIAAGARPIVPKLPGLDQAGYVTSDTLWDEFSKLEAIPSHLVVLGGGPIGCELTQAFARLGAKVTQVQNGPRLLPREDDEVSREVENSAAERWCRYQDIPRGGEMRTRGGPEVHRAGPGCGRRDPGRVRSAHSGRGPIGPAHGLWPGGPRHRDLPHRGDQRISRNPLSQYLRGGRRRGPLSVHPHRRAPGVVRLGQCALRPPAAIQSRLPHHPLDHLRRSRGRARGAFRE